MAILGTRDFEILQKLFEYKVSDFDGICKRHFQNRDRTTACKRLEKLFRGSFIEKSYIHENYARKVAYSITPKGYRKISERFPPSIRRTELKSDKVLHDLKLSRIADRLMQSKGMADLKTENVIQSFNFGISDEDYAPFRRMNSDLFFKMKVDEKSYRFAIEYERSFKAMPRWSECLLNYHLENEIDAILYICENESVMNGLIRIEEELAKKYSPKVFFCLMDKFMTTKRHAIFKNVSGQKFAIEFHEEDYQHPTT